MATMKKQAKATAVEKGTFYECVWCGKEGTDSPCYSNSKKSVCGRMVETEKKEFCSVKCHHIYSVETNRRKVIYDIDFANMILADIKEMIAEYIEQGEKLPSRVLQTAKLVNIFKKVLTFIVSGDKLSARKLYDEKKEIVTDCAEDLLADEVWGDLYMFFINRFVEIAELMRDEVSV